MGRVNILPRGTTRHDNSDVTPNRGRPNQELLTADDILASVTSLSPGTTLRFYVRAFDAAGNTSWRSNIASVEVSAGSPPDDTNRPSVPSGPTTTPQAGSIAFSWNPSQDDVAVTGYDLYRATSNGVAATLIGSSNSTTFVADDLQAGESVWYFVRAFDAAGNTGWRSGYVEGTAGAADGEAVDTERPSAPRGLTPGAIWTHHCHHQLIPRCCC